MPWPGSSAEPCATPLARRPRPLGGTCRCGLPPRAPAHRAQTTRPSRTSTANLGPTQREPHRRPSGSSSRTAACDISAHARRTTPRAAHSGRSRRPSLPTTSARRRTASAVAARAHITAAELRWCATIWSLNLDAFFEEGISAISHNLDWHTALWENRTYLEPLLDPDTPFSRAALVLVALGLAARDPTEQALAVDALETALVDGRTNGLALGAEIDWLVREQIAAPARLAATLTRLAGTSDLHAREVADAIERVIRFEAAKPPRGLHALLGLLARAAFGHVDRRERPASDRLPLCGDRIEQTRSARPRVARPTARFRSRGERPARATPRWRVERAERWMSDSARE